MNYMEFKLSKRAFMNPWDDYGRLVKDMDFEDYPESRTHLWRTLGDLDFEKRAIDYEARKRARSMGAVPGSEEWNNIVNTGNSKDFTERQDDLRRKKQRRERESMPPITFGL